MAVIDLSEARDLVRLVAEKRPERLDAYARRWIARLADERPLRLAEPINDRRRPKAARIWLYD